MRTCIAAQTLATGGWAAIACTCKRGRDRVHCKGGRDCVLLQGRTRSCARGRTDRGNSCAGTGACHGGQPSRALEQHCMSGARLGECACNAVTHAHGRHCRRRIYVARYIRSERMMYLTEPSSTAHPSCTMLWKKHSARPGLVCTTPISCSAWPANRPARSSN